MLRKSGRRPSDFYESGLKIKAFNIDINPTVLSLEHDQSIYGKCDVSVDRPLFQPEPSNLQLSNFNPFQSYNLHISFRNLDSIPRRLRVLQSDNVYFEVDDSKKLQSGKVAAGMTVEFVVKFSPEEYIDYAFQLICITDRERFMVPIYARGARGFLDLPDEILFTPSPVKLPVQRTIMATNIGQIPVTYKSKVNYPFSIEPNEAYIEVGGVIQLTVICKPFKCGKFTEELLIDYGRGDVVSIDVLGEAIEIDVALDKSMISMRSLITKADYKIVTLINLSDILLKFDWKLMANESEEDLLRQQRILDLQAGESKQSENVNDTQLIHQHFETLRRQCRDQSFLYHDPVFSFEPTSGSVWPGGNLEIKLRFRSDMVGLFETIAWCAVQGQENRLPLQLKVSTILTKAISIGPIVKFSVKYLDVGELYINSSKEYEILLENVGGVRSNYKWTSVHEGLSFEPYQGVIEVGAQTLMKIKMVPSTLGPFNIETIWQLDGGAIPLILLLKGTVIGPTYEFNVPIVDFKSLSFGFESIKKVTLSNTSQIEMTFDLLFLSEQGISSVSVIPQNGLLLGLDSLELSICMNPSFIGDFKGFLAVHVGETSALLPITAFSVVPKITVPSSVLAVGECYLGYEYIQNIELINSTNYNAAYYVLSDGLVCCKSYKFVFDAPRGIIEPNSVIQLPFRLTIKRLENMTIQVAISIAGSTTKSIDILVTGVGPQITSDVSSLNWGKVNVLETLTNEITLFNSSLIDADLALTTSTSVFKVSPILITIRALETEIIHATCYLDDSKKFSDNLDVAIMNGKSLVIPLSATGIGSTVVFDSAMANIDFEDVFSESSVSYYLVNKGRRSQHVTFTQTAVFSATPTRFSLKPNNGQIVTFKATSELINSLVGKMVCQVTSENELKRKLLVEISLKVNFVLPLLDFSSNLLHFQSSCESKEVELYNATSLSLTVLLSCVPPFNVYPSTLSIPPSTRLPITIRFSQPNPLARQSSTHTSRLNIAYQEHKNRTSLALQSNVVFPNLLFSRPFIDFGSHPLHTSLMEPLNMINPGPIAVSFVWSTTTQTSFDISPIHGTIPPLSSLLATVYYSFPNTQSAVMVCEVFNGPIYSLQVTAQVNPIQYNLTPSTLSFTSNECFLSIENTGLSDFSFNFITNLSVSGGSYLEAGARIKLVFRLDGISEPFVKLQVGTLERFNIPTSYTPPLPRILIAGTALTQIEDYSYNLDLGIVTFNSAHTQLFSILNSSASVLSVIVKSEQWKVSFEKVKVIPPNSKQEYTISTESIIDLGAVYVQIINGPLVLLQVVGQVCKPNLTFSRENLDFGTVIAGYEASFLVKVCNVGLVGSQFGYKRGKEKVFDMCPNSAYLAMGESIDIKVLFRPLKSADSCTVLRLDVVGGKYELKVHGVGVIPLLTFEPVNINLQSKVFVEDRVPLKVTNSSTVDLDVFYGDLVEDVLVDLDSLLIVGFDRELALKVSEEYQKEYFFINEISEDQMTEMVKRVPPNGYLLDASAVDDKILRIVMTLSHLLLVKLVDLKDDEKPKKKGKTVEMIECFTYADICNLLPVQTPLKDPYSLFITSIAETLPPTKLSAPFTLLGPGSKEIDTGKWQLKPSDFVVFTLAHLPTAPSHYSSAISFLTNNTIYSVKVASSVLYPPLQALKNIDFGFVLNSKSLLLAEAATCTVLPSETCRIEGSQIVATPKSTGPFEAFIVATTKDNPAVNTCKVFGFAVKVDVEVDKKSLLFEKVLLGRTEVRDLKIRNVGKVTAMIKLVGLTEEFTLSHTISNFTSNLLSDADDESKDGKIEVPVGFELTLSVAFKALKPLLLKRVVKLEIKDSIDYAVSITAEGYAISLDVHLIKDLLDYGIMKINEENKALVTLKNRGKYEVGFKFLLDALVDVIAISPDQGIVQPSDKPTFIQVVAKSSRELDINDTILKCIIFEPSTGEVTQAVPVRVAMKVVYNKAFISPIDSQFGSLVMGLKGFRSFSISNDGEFDFKFSISSTPPNPLTIGLKRKDDRVFAIAPLSGIIQPHSKLQINVEFHTDTPGSYLEVLLIDIPDRLSKSPLEHHLHAEACIPGIDTSLASFFEEQIVLSNSSKSLLIKTYTSVDNTFHFGPYLPQTSIKCRFKLSNPFKVSTDVNLTTRPKGGAFEVEPKRLTISPKDCSYILVTFNPLSIANYDGVLEISVDTPFESKNKAIALEMKGEGTLPLIKVDRREVAFGRVWIGAEKIKGLLVSNIGGIKAVVKTELVRNDFNDSKEFVDTGLRLVEAAAVELDVDHFHNINVIFKPKIKGKIECELRLKVQGNAYEDIMIALKGEGIDDLITLNGLNDDNELDFKCCPIGNKTVKVLQVNNHARIAVVVEVLETLEFTVKLKLLTIRAGEAADIPVLFHPTHVVQYTKIQSLIKVRKAHVDDVGKGLVDIPIYFSASADYANYDCEINQIIFKSTMMYMKRVYRFQLLNNSKVHLPFNLKLFDDIKLEQELNESMFDVEPCEGIVLSNDIITFTVSFKPNDVGLSLSYLALAFQNLSPKASQIKIIELRGQSERPLCHFELEDVDVDPTFDRKSSIEQGSRVLDIKGVGIKVRILKRFYVLNPTDSRFEFWWKEESSSEDIRCLTLKGSIVAKKKFEMVFEYEAVDLNIRESQWTFNIPINNVRIPFLIVCQAFEPLLYIKEAGLCFKEVMVGHSVKEVIRLVNDEDIPFSYALIDTSGEANLTGIPILKFTPISGVILAKSTIQITVTFTPSIEKEYNFNLMCVIKKKKERLLVNFKGEGYAQHVKIMKESMNGLVELSSDCGNDILFGRVLIKERKVVRIWIVNGGRFSVEYNWNNTSSKAKSGNKSGIIVRPEIGAVGKGERAFCDLIFEPNIPITMKDLKLTCDIVNGISFDFVLNGVGMKPLLKLDPCSIDFGSHFVTTSTAQSSITKKIIITNTDVMEITVDIVSNENPSFEMSRSTFSLSPNESKVLQIAFKPVLPQTYTDAIELEINGLSRIEIPLLGEGSDIKLEVDPHFVTFGALQNGGSSTRTVKVTNKSKLSAQLLLGPSNTILDLKAIGITFVVSDIMVKAKASSMIDVRFQPHRRTVPFEEVICIDFLGILKPLFSISGACQGIEVVLESDSLPFGPVVLKGELKRRLMLINRGDLGAKFTWINNSKYFDMVPQHGYITSGTELSMEFKFRPLEIDIDVREVVSCSVENGTTLFLTLSGICTAISPPMEVLKFLAPVRTVDLKSITIYNKGNIDWILKPSIENEIWSGADTLEVEAGSSKLYELLFEPLVSGSHDGSIFIPLPDGSAIVYKLQGIAEKPVQQGIITREIVSKVSHIELLEVRNWSRSKQKFSVVYEFAKPDLGVQLKGLDSIEVLPLSTKEYKLAFYAYKEAQTNFKVIFRNELTKEYLFYNLNYRTITSGVIDTIEICCPIRQLQTRDIVISNPLLTPVIFYSTSNNADLTVPHTLTIPPKSDLNVTLEFLAFFPRECLSRLTLTSPDLGVYLYDIKLKSLPAGLEAALNFHTNLGNQHSKILRFINFAKTRTDYTVKLESVDFTIDKSISTPASSSLGSEVLVEVVYEPSKIGDTKVMLVLSSTIGGDYTYPLYAHCTAPKPQGPLIIKAGTPTTLNFKNVFNNAILFTCTVDNPAFTVKATEMVGAKKVMSLAIGYKTGVIEKGKGKKGKLTISSQSSVSWVYYLNYTA